MQSRLLRRTLLGSLLTVSLTAISAPTRAVAQDAGNAPADTHDDGGFDKGLLGLLGLAGLLGLRRGDTSHRARTDRV